MLSFNHSDTHNRVEKKNDDENEVGTKSILLSSEKKTADNDVRGDRQERKKEVK